jgi:hypothetical protein
MSKYKRKKKPSSDDEEDEDVSPSSSSYESEDPLSQAPVDGPAEPESEKVEVSLLSKRTYSENI